MKMKEYIVDCDHENVFIGDEIFYFLEISKESKQYEELMHMKCNECVLVNHCIVECVKE